MNGLISHRIKDILSEKELFTQANKWTNETFQNFKKNIEMKIH